MPFPKPFPTAFSRAVRRRYNTGVHRSRFVRKLTGALFLLLTVLAFQAYAKAPAISALVVQARYVALGYETAQGFVAETDFAAFSSASVQPDDRQALANIYEALRKWNRYVVTVFPQDADMLIAVRTGRRASAYGGVRIDAGRIDPGGTRRSGPSIGPVVGAEAGPADDYLAVYQANEGREAAQLWVRTQDDGLAGKNPPLFQSFKDEVESAAKRVKSKKP